MKGIAVIGGAFYLNGLVNGLVPVQNLTRPVNRVILNPSAIEVMEC